MDSGLALLNPREKAHWPVRPAPKLLLEHEPAHRVFIGNFMDLLARRQASQVHAGIEALPFWRDVLIPPGEFGWSLLESALWHTVAVLLMVIISLGPKQIERRLMHKSRIVYYKRDHLTFPALGGSPPRNFVRREHNLEARKALRVAREAKPLPIPLVAPPNLASLTDPAPLSAAAGATRVAPAMPLAAVPPSQRRAPRIGGSVIEPPPDIKQAAGRRGGGLGVTPVAPAPVLGSGLGHTTAGAAAGFRTVVVPPAPVVGAVSGRSGMAGPGGGIRAVPPAPVLRGDSLERMRKAGDGNLMHVVVVAPAPGLPTEGSGMLRRQAQAGLGGTGTAVVPPPPSAQGLGSGREGEGRGSFGSGVAAVPPAPSVHGLGRSMGIGTGGGSLAGASASAAVPPPPSVNGVGGSGGMSTAGAGLGGDPTSAAVPPPPSVDGTGGLNGRGSGGFPGGSLSAVPPAPSVGGGAGGNGRGAGTLADGSVVSPSPSMDSMVNSNLDQGLKPVVLELPVRIVGLAFALPSTSFSSNYEVFLAEKELSGHKEQLIKLVYWFLPYQERLSDYSPDASKMYKLRVTRDHACDESLAHMTLSSQGQVYPDPNSPLASLLASPGIRDLSLPCYRTTADDYRKAMSGKH
jgi:hypothetical protein